MVVDGYPNIAEVCKEVPGVGDGNIHIVQCTYMILVYTIYPRGPVVMSVYTSTSICKVGICGYVHTVIKGLCHTLFTFILIRIKQKCPLQTEKKY